MTYLFAEPNYELKDELYFRFAKGKYDYYEVPKYDYYVAESDMTEFAEYIADIIGAFHYYGFTEIDESSWEKLVASMDKAVPKVQNIMHEVKPWAEESIMEMKAFTIYGL